MTRLGCRLIDLHGAKLYGAVNVSLPDGWTLNKHGIAKRDNKNEVTA